MYELLRPKKWSLPILVSSPHSGTIVPTEVADAMASGIADSVEDTDWFVDRLYDFLPAMGISILNATHSRYVVDLNRSRQGAGLYTDGRKETGVIPLKSFAGKKIYRSGQEPDDVEMERRLELYYDPYHAKLKTLMREIKQSFPRVLLFDAHSILSRVPSIQTNEFPDLILGNDDGRTCPKAWIVKAKKLLEVDGYSVALNHPFKGGAITREMAAPEQGIFSLQLEMSQKLYMNETTKEIDLKKFEKVQQVLKSFFIGMGSLT